MSKIFKAKLESLHEILNWVRDYFLHEKISKKKLGHIELALEEALVNVFLYAYPDSEGQITISIDKDETNYFIKLVDNGISFNPLTYETKNIPGLPLNNLKEGGLGISFFKKLVDEIDYQRLDKSNILVFKINK